MKEQESLHEKRRNLLVEQINNVKKNGCIKIYAGEMNCFVYDHDDVDKAVRKAAARGIQITVVAGPTLSVRETGKSHVVDWAKEGLINLHYKKARYHDEHFRLLNIYHEGKYSGKYVYAERPHEAMKPGEQIELTSAVMEYWFDQNERDFDFLTKEYPRVTDPLKVFLPLTPSELEKAKMLANRKRGENSFNYMTKEEIKELLEKA